MAYAERTRLTLWGAFSEPDRICALEVIDNGVYMTPKDRPSGAPENIWIPEWDGQEVVLRSAMNEPMPTGDEEAPFWNDAILCEKTDSRVYSWVREVLREEFDKAVEAEARRCLVSPRRSGFVEA